jgi:hypothetical protein
MRIEWLKGAKTPQAKKERKAIIINSREGLEVLRTILETKLSNLEDNATKADDYNVSNWAYLQADINGCKRTYKEIIDLLSIEESK